MASNTRTQLLDTAQTLFAERGFYGVSIASIADELGLTKQALLHHFGTKEKLYGAVLQRISEYFQEQLADNEVSVSDPAKRLEAYLLNLSESALKAPVRSQLLMRELLDNKRRVETAGMWYLKPYLDRLSELVREIPEWEHASQENVFVLVYQLLGAINYFVVSQPTLQGIYGQDRISLFRVAFPNQLSHLLAVSLQT
ncbi:MAG: TetR/AcrR family transcriptional regulator [Pseudomonadota bacterium]